MSKAPRIDSWESRHLVGDSVFAGTIVPVQKLFEYLAAGKTVDKFLTDFPFISREQVVAALDQVAYGVKYEPEPRRPFFRWLFGAFVSPFAVAVMYIRWTDWMRYPYRDVTDHVALALGISVGVLFLFLLPIHWVGRVAISAAYAIVVSSLAYGCFAFASTIAGDHH